MKCHNYNFRYFPTTLEKNLISLISNLIPEIIRIDRETTGPLLTKAYEMVSSLPIGGDCFMALPIVFAHSYEITSVGLLIFRVPGIALGVLAGRLFLKIPCKIVYI